MCVLFLQHLCLFSFVSVFYLVSFGFLVFVLFVCLFVCVSLVRCVVAFLCSFGLFFVCCVCVSDMVCLASVCFCVTSVGLFCSGLLGFVSIHSNPSTSLFVCALCSGSSLYVFVMFLLCR